MSNALYFPSATVVLPENYAVSESDPDTAWQVQPHASAHYYPSVRPIIDNNNDGTDDSALAPTIPLDFNLQRIDFEPIDAKITNLFSFVMTI